MPRLRVASKEDIPFTFAGQCDDEVTFTFNNTEKQLFVSRNFLSLVSPVFRTMFTSDFKEKKESVVEMKDKEYGEVFEFLLILYPCGQKSVSEANVYSVLCLAEEYKVKTLIERCKSILSEILVEKFKVIEKADETELRKTEAAHACIMVLSTSLTYRYHDLKTSALKTISRFGSKVFLNDTLKMTNGKYFDEITLEVLGPTIAKKVDRPQRSYDEQDRRSYARRRSTDRYSPDHITTGATQQTIEHSKKTYEFIGCFGNNWIEHTPSGVVSKRQDCRDVYNKLPDSVKITILQNRLDLLEDDEIHGTKDN